MHTVFEHFSFYKVRENSKEDFLRFVNFFCFDCYFMSWLKPSSASLLVHASLPIAEIKRDRICLTQLHWTAL